MALLLKPSDLYFKYGRDPRRKHEPKFAGLPDPSPCNRDDLYELLPLFTAVMEALPSDDGRVLNLLEELLATAPRCLESRGELYSYLLAAAREALAG